MGASSTSTTSSSVAATNPALNNLFTSLFSGGLATGATNTLQGIMSGQTMAGNTSQLYKTLYQSGQPGYQAGLAQINEQAARAGLSNSSSVVGETGSYTTTYLSNLNQLATTMGLQETNMQGGIAGNLMSMLATAGSQYFTDKSSTTATMPWTQTFGALMGGAMNMGSLFAGGGALEGLNPWG